MHTPALSRMTADEFLVWADGREGRWELHNGIPYSTSPDTVGHGDAKMAVYVALLRAARATSAPCRVIGSGIGIRVSNDAMYVPDATVYCGEKLPGDSMEVPNPVILVEVSSPSTREMEETVKLDGYFSLPSVRHYLIIDPHGPPVVHYSRQADGSILRSVVHEGALTLAPPGLEVGVAELFVGEP